MLMVKGVTRVMVRSSSTQKLVSQIEYMYYFISGS